jgi:asparaginyl-tRNA synthetase
MPSLIKEFNYIKDLQNFEGKKVILQGWVQNRRDSKGIVFIILRDGTGFIQCVVLEETIGTEMFDKVKRLGLESSIRISGTVRKDEKQIGGYEIQADTVEIFTEAEDYPIGKKDHGIDFLLSRRHLWLRSKKQWAIMRIRNQVIFSIHTFFQNRGYVQMDAPIFTGNAVEGTTNLFETDFFEEPAYLSQSGQLYGEAMAMAMGKIYTFGPTFRAEKSKTRRHLSEFWMIEPEMAFYDLEMTMDVIEDFIRTVVTEVLDKCKDEFAIIERDVTKLETVVKPFPRIPYDDAVSIIRGEKDVNGKNAIKSLEEDLIAIREEIIETYEEIVRRLFNVKRSRANIINIPFDEVVKKIRLIQSKKTDLNDGEKALIDLGKAIDTVDMEYNEIKLRLGRVNDHALEIFNEVLKTQILNKGQINFNEEKILQLRQKQKDLEESERNIPQWLESAKNFERGNDFGGSDETVITRLFDTPIMVYNWPKAVKAFYMKEEPTQPGIAKGVDVLAPEGYGEIVGGGERETDINKLIDAIHHHELPMQAFEWYLDLRRYGSVPHSGFGLGLERIICWVCKLPHVRESIPFPRFVGNLFP